MLDHEVAACTLSRCVALVIAALALWFAPSGSERPRVGVGVGVGHRCRSFAYSGLRLDAATPEPACGRSWQQCVHCRLRYQINSAKLPRQTEIP